MSETLVVKVVMAWDIEEERIRGLEYSHDPSRLGPSDNGKASFRGDHRTRVLEEGKDGVWLCSCRSFHRLHPVADCRHIIAAQRILRRQALSSKSATVAGLATSLTQCHQ